VPKVWKKAAGPAILGRMVQRIVNRPTDFAWRKEIVCTIEWIAAHEGMVLFARS
jgi:hypothetical protein